jgi:hypothetical protein
MPGAKQSKGACGFCGAEIAANAVTKHLSVCQGRQAAIEKAARKKAAPESLFHLHVRDAAISEFWLHLEMRGSGTLNALDSYLRGIWLECCGHASQFSVGGWGGDAIAKTRKIGQVFEPELELTHIYDFGTSSETLIKAVGVREGVPVSARPIALLARNLMPECRCIECRQPASWLCMECVTEEEQWGTLCDKHAQTHPHKNYGKPIRLVNSPRLGMCGYTGPAEPPY